MENTLADQDGVLTLTAQVQALEMVVKTLIALQLAATVKDEAEFARATELISQLSLQTQARVRAIGAEMQDELRDNLVIRRLEQVMVETVARCFEQPAVLMANIGKIALDMEAPLNI